MRLQTKKDDKFFVGTPKVAQICWHLGSSPFMLILDFQSPEWHSGCSVENVLGVEGGWDWKSQCQQTQCHLGPSADGIDLGREPRVHCLGPLTPFHEGLWCCLQV